LYSQAIELDPDHYRAYVSLGSTLILKQDYCRAVNTFEKAIEIQPYEPKAFEKLGTALFSMTQLKDGK
jgi:tetratricopeptide (TPR) repeat protein